MEYKISPGNSWHGISFSERKMTSESNNENSYQLFGVLLEIAWTMIWKSV